VHDARTGLQYSCRIERPTISQHCLLVMEGVGIGYGRAEHEINARTIEIRAIYRIDVGRPTHEDLLVVGNLLISRIENVFSLMGADWLAGDVVDSGQRVPGGVRKWRIVQERARDRIKARHRNDVSLKWRPAVLSGLSGTWAVV
jgi:hypothetical protein